MNTPSLVYFSSVTDNTHVFLQQIKIEKKRIPVRRGDPEISVDKPFILVVPTYGAGRDNDRVPRQVIKFLKDPTIRKLCVGIIGAGNINFGEYYCAAADQLSARMKIPVLYRFELRGTLQDAEKITEGIEAHWEELLKLRGLDA